MSFHAKPVYSPVNDGFEIQLDRLDGQSHTRSPKCPRRRHWISWTFSEGALLIAALLMAIALVTLSAYVLARHDNKLVVSTNPNILLHAKFVQGAWLTAQSVWVMALMLPIWNCVTIIKSEEWIRMASKSASMPVKYIHTASTTTTSAWNSVLYAQSRQASPVFRFTMLIATLAFAVSTTSHGLLFLNVVKVDKSGTSLQIGMLGENSVYRLGEQIGQSRRSTGSFEEESAIRLASLLYLGRNTGSRGSLSPSLSYTADLYDTSNATIPNFVLPTPATAPDGSIYETDVITFDTSCQFYAPSEVISPSGGAGGLATIRYSWNEATRAVQIQLDDGTNRVVGATIALPQNVAPVSYLTSPDTLLDYSDQGYTGWLVISNSHFNSVKVDGLPSTGNLTAFAAEADHTLASVLLCQPNFVIQPTRVQYGLQHSQAYLTGKQLVGNIDKTQAGFMFSSMMAAIHRAPGNSSFVGSDDIFSTSIVLDQARQYTKDQGWIHPNPLSVIEQNLSPYYAAIGKAYLNGASSPNVTSVLATIPVDGMALSTSKANFYASLALFVILLGFLAIVSFRRVLPLFELLPVLEVFSDVLQQDSVDPGRDSTDKLVESGWKDKRVTWKADEGHFRLASTDFVP